MSDNEVFESWCYSQVNIETGRLVWKISDFSKRTEMVKSCVFPSSAPQDLGKWCLWLYPKRENEFNKSQNGRNNEKFSEPHTSIVIYQLEDVEIWATVRIFLLNDKGNVDKSVCTRCHKFTQQTYSGFPRFVERSYILDKNNGILDCDELSIVCEIEIRRSFLNRYQELNPFELNRPRSTLAKDISYLLASGLLSDCSITVGEREFRVHKAILGARSPVFAAMFLNEMVEKKYSSVEIADINSDVFQKILEYIYTDNVLEQMDCTKELLAAASKYELEGLTFMCGAALCNDTTVDNVLDNLILADHYNATFLKEYCLGFIMKNGYDVINHSSWDNFKRTHQSVALEIFEKICFSK